MRLTITLFRPIIIGVLFLTLSAQADQADLVGATLTQLEVSPSGQASFSTPITVPSGIDKTRPSVSISYSSEAGNGVLGLGGQVNGISAISRCGSTVAQEGVFRGVRINTDDRFCLGGQKLVAISGDYGANGAEYRTEINNFQRVVSFGARDYVDGGTGPESFRVTLRNGTTIDYGSTEITRIQASSTAPVHAWMVSQLEDINGNTINYQYHDFGQNIDVTNYAEKRISAINYGGNPSAGIASNLSVKFGYETRPDTSLGFNHGLGSQQSQRLESINTVADGVVVRQYQFEYDQAPLSGVSRLTHIQECAGADGINGCLRPSILTWHEEATGWTSSSLIPPDDLYDANGNARGLLADVNADGWQDMVIAHKTSSGDENLTTWMGSQNGWLASTSFVPPAPLSLIDDQNGTILLGELIDLNADGLPDWVQSYQGNGDVQQHIWLNDGSAWVASSDFALPMVMADISDATASQNLLQFLDLDADGLPDALVATRDANGGAHINAWHNTGTDFAEWPAYAFASEQGLFFDYLSGFEQVQGRFADIDGDGLVDWLRAYEDQNGNVTAQTWLNTGEGWQVDVNLTLPVALTSNLDLSDGYAVSELTDLNADGLPDLVQSHRRQDGSELNNSWLNTGTHWVASSEYQAPFILNGFEGGDYFSDGGYLDVSGDGLPEIVQSYRRANGDEVQTIWQKTGNQWATANQFNLPSVLSEITSSGHTVPLLINIDLNADGASDLLAATAGYPRGGFMYGLGDSDADPAFAHPHTIVQTENGLGSVSQIEYGLGHVDGLYTPSNDAVLPALDVPMLGVIIKASLSSNGIGEFSRVVHRYGGLKVDTQGRGSLGFAWRSITDTQSGIEMFNEYQQGFPYTGRIEVAEKRYQGAQLSRNVNTDTILELNQNKTVYPYTAAKSSIVHDLNGSLISTTQNTRQIDQYGSLMVDNSQATDAQGITAGKLVEYTLSHDVENWLLGMVTRTQTTLNASGQDNIVRVGSSEYNAKGQTTRIITEPGHSQSVETSYVYDALGNVTTTTTQAGNLPSRSASITYSADGRFPLSATNSLGHTASSEYDGRFGEVIKTTDPNGQVTRKILDPFGKMLTEVKERRVADEEDGAEAVLLKWCSEVNSCPDNAVYIAGAADNQKESPESAYYDERGREIRKQTFGFDGTPIYQDTEYDAKGRKSRVSQTYFKDDTPRWASNQYDVLDRVTQATYPDGSSQQISYDALTTQSTNGLGQTRVEVKNIQGKLVSVTDAMQNVAQYQYDAAGRLLNTLDPNGNQIINQYDLFGRKTQSNDPDTGIWHYQYDAWGNLVSQTDAKGQQTTFVYDALNRQTEKHSPDGDVTWVYDSAENGIGALSSVSGPDDYSRSHSYDDLTRPSEVTTITDGQSFSITRHYAGTTDNIDYVQYPNDMMVRTAYNEYGFPTSVRSSGLDAYQLYLDQYQVAQDKAQQARDLETQNQADMQAAADQANALFAQARGPAEQANHWVAQTQDAVRQYNYHVDLARRGWDKYNVYANAQQQYVNAHNKKVTEYNNKVEEINNYKSRIWGTCDREDGFMPCLIPNPVPRPSYDLAVAEREINRLNNGIKDYGREASRYANIAQSYYNEASVWAGKVEQFNGYAQAAVNQANQIYAQAQVYVNTFNRLQGAVQALVDSANKASKRAEELFADYEGDSTLQWVANTIDAQGRLIQFKQGNDVVTDIDYDAIGRVLNMTGVTVASEAESETPEEGSGAEADIPLLRLDDLLGALQSMIVEFSSELNLNIDLASQAQDAKDEADVQLVELAQTKAEHEANGETALALMTEAQIHHANLDADQQQIAIARANGLANIFASSLNEANNLHAQYQNATGGRAANRLRQGYHQILRDHHQSLNGLYANISALYAPVAAAYAALQVPDDLETLVDLSETQESLATLNQLRLTVYQDQQDQQATTNNTDSGRIQTLAYNDYVAAALFEKRAKVHEQMATLVEQIYTPVRQANTHLAQEYLATDNQHTLVDVGQNTRDALAARVSLGQARSSHYTQLAQKMRDRAAHYTSRVQQYGEDGQDQIVDFSAQYSQLAYMNQVLAEEYFQLSTQDHWQELYDAASAQLLEAQTLYQDLSVEHNTMSLQQADAYEDAQSVGDHELLAGGNGQIVDMSYQYDVLGNMQQRTDNTMDVSEDFAFDGLNRITSSTMSGLGTEVYQMVGLETTTFDYDVLGNITYRSDVGYYGYGNGNNNSTGIQGVHAVQSITAGVGGNQNTASQGDYAYDANGNMISGGGRTIEVGAHNKATHINANGHSLDMTYGPEGQLVKQVDTDNNSSGDDSTGPKTTIHIGSLYEQISDASGITHRYHIAVRGGITSVINHKENQTPKTHYLHRDHLDSIVAISDRNGELLERYHFDAFGKRRTAIVDPSDVLNQTVFTPPTIGDVISQRGFTGHVRLAGIGLIHMKGRLYDATIGRFISADPQVQFTYDLQSFNRYSYTHNNPLKFVDPSGYGFFKKLFKKLKKAFKKVGKLIKKVVKKVVKFVKKYWKQILVVAIVVLAPYALAAIAPSLTAAVAGGTAFAAGLTATGTIIAGAIGGGLAGFIATGSLKGALIGALSGAAFAGIGNTFSGVGKMGKWVAKFSDNAQKAMKVVSHGVAGGLRSVASGGKFKTGFLSGSFTAYASPAIGASNLSPAGEVVAAGVVGGIGSRIGGGSFEDGFVTGVFSHGFNHHAHARNVKSRYSDLRNRVGEAAANSSGPINLSIGDIKIISEYMNLQADTRSAGFFGSFGGSSDTFLRYDGYGGREFNVDGMGTYTGGELNYIGVGATAGHYGFSPSGTKYLVGAWNLNQYANPFLNDGFGQTHNITSMGAMIEWANYGLLNYYDR